MPTTEEALAMLKRIWDERKLGYDAKFSVKHDWAGLEIFTPDIDESVVVYSPGDRWVSLDVPGGFSAIYLEEEISNIDLQIWLERYLDAGIAYLEGHFVVRHSQRLRIPHVVIETNAGPVRLDLGIKALIRSAVSRGRLQ